MYGCVVSSVYCSVAFLFDLHIISSLGFVCVCVFFGWLLCCVVVCFGGSGFVVAFVVVVPRLFLISL